MGIGDARADDLTVIVEHDGSIWVDVGSRAVAVEAPDLERILDRLAADGGTLRLLGGPAARTTVMNRRIMRATPRWAPPPTSWRSPTSSASR